MKALKAGDLHHRRLVVWVHLDQALGARGMTTDSPTKLAKALGLSTKTIQRAVADLAAQGVVTVASRSDVGWRLERPTASVLQLPTTKTPPFAGNLGPVDDGHGCHLELDTVVTTKELTPVLLAPETLKPLSCERSEEPYVQNARCSQVRPQAAEEKTITKTETKPPQRQATTTRDRIDVRRACSVLPREVFTAEGGRWARAVRASVARFLDAGHTVATAQYALDALVDPETHSGRVVQTVKEALRAVANDIRLGLADPATGRPISPDADDTHQDGEDEQLPLVERLKTYRALKMTSQQIRAIDPEATTALTEEDSLATLSVRMWWDTG